MCHQLKVLVLCTTVSPHSRCNSLLDLIELHNNYQPIKKFVFEKKKNKIVPIGLLRSRANPKSQSLTTPSLVRRIFSGLTSRWMQLWAWQYPTACNVCQMIRFVNTSGTLQNHSQISLYISLYILHNNICSDTSINKSAVYISVIFAVYSDKSQYKHNNQTNNANRELYYYML